MCRAPERERGLEGMVKVGGLDMNKLWPDARAALDGIVQDGMLLAIGGFGLVRHSRGADSCLARHWRAQPDHRQQQRRRGWVGTWDCCSKPIR